MEATNLLNRQEKKKNNTTAAFNTRPYMADSNYKRGGFFVDLDKTDPIPHYQEDNFVRPDYPELKKTISAQ